MKGAPKGIVITIFAFISAVYFVYTFGGFNYTFETGSPNLRFSSPKEFFTTTSYANLSQIIPTTNLCPNLNSQDFHASNGILNSKIAIVLAVLKQNDYGDYMISINTTQCYARHFGYQMHFINMSENPKIQQHCNHTDVFFKRHCALALFMEDNKETIDYVLYIDADMGVINPCHTIQNYLDKNEKVEIIFYERYYDHEIAAGSYLVRNSEYSRKFIRFWADYFYRLPQSFHGTDNGAIHQVFMELNFPDNQSKMQCYNLWNTSKGYDDLFAYQACTKHALSSNTSLFVNDTVKLIRKMTPGWVRDGWLTGTKWSLQDFMFHGWKQSKLGGEWQWPFANLFDMDKCQFCDSSFPNFQYLPQFVSSNHEINSVLENKVKSVGADYIKILKKLKLICENGSESKNNTCS